MFDLEKAIAFWRSGLEHRRAFSTDDLDELERHLRDHVEVLVAGGRPERAAFREALDEMGDYAAAEVEYKKVWWGKLRRERKLKSEFIWRLAMLKNYLKVALRTMRRQPGYTAINLLGLAAGLACCLVVVVFVQEERSYDRFHRLADRTYRVVTTMQFSGGEAPVVAPGPLGPALVELSPGVVDQARVRCIGDPFVVERKAERFSESGLCYADPSFFSVFDFPLCQGDPQTALGRPYTLVLSDDLARKFFGADDPIGQTLRLGGEQVYEVTGVLAEPPGRSHFEPRFLASFATLEALDPVVETWAEGGANPFVVLAPGYSSEQLQAHLDGRLDDYMGLFASSTKAYVQPLTEIYFSDPSSWPQSASERRGDVRYLYLFSTVALLILIVADINYMNLATARALRRAREVGVRKAVGATRVQLVRQFLSEAVLLSLLAFVLAFVLAWFALPLFGKTIGRLLETTLLLEGGVLLPFLGIVLLVGLLAGSYPAFYLAAFDAVAVLKGRASTGRGAAWLRKGLVVTQFTVSIGLVACTVVMWHQLNYVRNRSLGFDKERVVVITTSDAVEGQYAAFKRSLLALPDVQGVTTAPMPGHIGMMIVSHRVEGYNHEAEGIPWIASFEVDEDFLNVLDIDLIAGRNLDSERGTDAQEAVMVNETAVRDFGWGSPEEALGKVVRRPSGKGKTLRMEPYRVVGVVGDFQSWTAKRALDPILIYLTEDVSMFNEKVLVKLRPGGVPGALARLEDVWARFAPDDPFQYAFMDQEVDAFYRAETRLGRLLSGFSLLVVGIACLGLFGLAAFSAEQRTKEIGIRKAIGASVPGLIKLLCRDYLILVGLAFLVAAPLAYLAMRQWLDRFAYAVDVGLGTLLLVGLGALFVALLTVSYQAIKAAHADPVEALRYE